MGNKVWGEAELQIKVRKRAKIGELGLVGQGDSDEKLEER